jgi:uncharacterized membrane protein
MSTIIGVFESASAAENAIASVRDAGVSIDDISYIYRDKDGDIKDAQTDEKVGAGAAKGATTGAVIGAIAGLVVANGVLPGLGTLFVAGPLAAALGLSGAAATTVAGAATGAAAGGVIGALTNLGVSKDDAEIYESRLEQGDILLIIRTDVEGVEQILQNNGASEVRGYVND